MWWTVITLKTMPDAPGFDVVRLRLLGAVHDKTLGADSPTDASFDDQGAITLCYRNDSAKASRATTLSLDRLEKLKVTANLPTLVPYAIYTGRRRTQPVPKLLGASEFAEILGVTKARISQLRNSDGFPGAVAKLHMGPVYLERDVLEYLDRREGLASRRAAI